MDANWIPTPGPRTLKSVEMASPFANRSLRLPSFANEEYIGNLVALAATTAIPYQIHGRESKINILVHAKMEDSKDIDEDKGQQDP